MAKALTEYQTLEGCDVIIWDDGSVTFRNGWEDITLNKFEITRLENLYWAWIKFFKHEHKKN